MVVFDDIDNEEEAPRTTAGTFGENAGEAVDDLAAGRECLKRLGEEHASHMLGTLLRLHRPQEYKDLLAPAKAEEERIAAEKKAGEERVRLAAEAVATAEEERIAAEKKAEEERMRLAAEAAAKAEEERVAEMKAEKERMRLTAEAAAAKVEEERIAADKKAEEERVRLATEAAAKAEEERIAAEKKAEEERIRVAAEAAAKAEEERIAAEMKAEEEKLRLFAEEAAKAEEERIAAEKKAEEERMRLLAEAAANAEEERVAAEMKAEEEKLRLAAEAAAKAEEERIAADQKTEEERVRPATEAAAKAEEERIAAEKLAAEAAAKEEEERIQAYKKAHSEKVKLAAEAAAEAEEERIAAEAAATAEEEIEIRATEAAAKAAKVPKAPSEEPIVLKDRKKARLSRWDPPPEDEYDSSEEAIGILSSLSRSFSLFGRAVGIGLSMALSSDPTTAGKQIAQMCRAQGGIYVKAAQMISAMPFAFPQEVIEEFESLQDLADPQPWSDLVERVDSGTPGGIKFIYESFDEASINAASIAQVHQATRKTGERVAVKVLRPGINKTFKSDVSNYLGLLGMYETATGIEVKWMTSWVMEELKKEIDFRNEAQIHEEAQEFLSEVPEIRGQLCIPELHSELCTRKLLVMEWVNGCKITKAPELFSDWDKERDLPQIFDALENWSAAQVFLTGKFHGDPHPGNIMLRRKKEKVSQGITPFEVVVLDHGGYYQIPDDVRREYAEVWLMMDQPKDESQRLRRKKRITEILGGWGVGHPTRFVIEQMLCGHFGTADPTSTIRENGDARMHRFNLMNQNQKEYGAPMFSDTDKMSKELMKSQGSSSFMSSIWRALAGKMKGWNAPERKRGIMMKWAARSPGVKRPP